VITIARDRLCPDGVKIAERFDQELLTAGKAAHWGDLSNYLRCHTAWCEACSRMQGWTEDARQGLQERKALMDFRD